VWRPGQRSGTNADALRPCQGDPTSRRGIRRRRQRGPVTLKRSACHRDDARGRVKNSSERPVRGSRDQFFSDRALKLPVEGQGIERLFDARQANDLSQGSGFKLIADNDSGQWGETDPFPSHKAKHGHVVHFRHHRWHDVEACTKGIELDPDGRGGKAGQGTRSIRKSADGVCLRLSAATKLVAVPQRQNQEKNMS